MSLPYLHFPSKLPVQTIAQNFSGGVDVLRLDELHPVISGNKWFKLKEHLHLAVTAKATGLVTYGGAWSNHLVAVAYAARQLKLPSAGIVRGEQLPFSAFSQTLKDCLNYGMQLFFLSREEYSHKDELVAIASLQQQFPGYHRIPEGAADAAGVHGAATIVNTVPAFHTYTHICCSIGTGTMLAGIASACAAHQTAIGFSVFKKADGIREMVEALVPAGDIPVRFELETGYSFGGYGKFPPELIDFMNQFYRETSIPTDIVYSAKLMAGVSDLFNKGCFPHGAKVLAVHCGGLQGNRSLPAGTLLF